MANAKRLLAVLLAVMVCLCSFPIVLAESVGTLTLNQPMELEVKGDGSETVVEFIPDADGFYRFSSIGATGDPKGRLCNYDGSLEFISDDDSGDANNFSFAWQCSAGQTYLLCVNLLSGSGTVTVQVTQSKIATIAAPPAQLIYGYDSYTVTQEDAQGEQLAYEHFSFDNYRYEVILKDGTRVECVGSNCVVDGVWCDVSFSCNQGYEKQWVVGTKTNVTLTVDGVTTAFGVEIIDTPIKKVEIDPVYRTLGSGSMSTDPIYDENGEYIGQTEEYLWYNLEFSTGRITFADGTQAELYGDGLEYNGVWHSIEVSDPQSYETQWNKAGDYTVNGSVLGFDFTYTVTVEPSPVEKLEISNLTYIEGTHGDYTKDSLYDDNGEYIGESDSYYIYNLYPDYKITLRDGTVIENDGFEWKGQWYGVNYYPTQDFHNQWTAGNTYTVPVECVGAQASFTVTIVESPVASVTFEPVTVVEKTHGDYVLDWLDGENQVYADPYFAYDVHTYMDLQYTVTLQGGETLQNGDTFTYMGEEYTMEYEPYSNQTYKAPWVAGNTYYAKATFAGKTVEFPVTILKSPVASVEFAPITIKEFEDGYYTRDWIENEYGEPIEQTEEYFVYNPSMNDIFVTMKDGTKYNLTQDMVFYEGVKYSFSFYPHDAQSYENQWQAGGTYEVPYSFCGMEGTFPVTIAKDYSNDLYECMGTEGGVIITGYKGQTDLPTLEIPAQIEGQPVIAVADLGSLETQNIVFPATVTTLSNELFYNMPFLKTIKLGEGIVNFDAQMIENNRELEALIVDSRNPNYSAKDFVLYNKDASRLIAVPLAVTEIEIPKTCTDASVLDLEMYAGVSVRYEEGHPDFATVDGVTYTKDMKTVVACDKTKEGSYNMPDSVTQIKPKAFLDCEGLTDVKISPKVTEIVYSAFAGCTSLTNVTLPQNLKTIGEYAFANTYELQTVDFPDGLTTIEMEAFLNGGLTRVILPDSVKEVYGYAFQYNPITLLDLGQGVEYIGVYAFAEGGLQRVNLPDSLTALGAYAFEGNISLQGLNIGKGLTEIPTGAFSNTGLVSVTVPKTVEIIGDSAFAYCEILISVDIQNPACNLGNFAFAGCNLQSLTLGDKMNMIPEGAFMGNAFTSVTIPQSVTSLVYGAFWNCENLEDITLPDNLQHFGGHVLDNTAWYNSQKDGVVHKDYITIGWKGEGIAPTMVNIPDTTKLIADYAFEDCAGMRKVNLGNSVESIGAYAFYGCKELSSITIPASVKEIGYNAFLGCLSLKNITVDKGNTQFYMENGMLCSAEGYVVFNPAVQDKVSHIEVIRDPYKTQYKQGEALDTSGLELGVWYESGFFEILTDGFTASLQNPEDTAWVKVTFGGEETGYWVDFAAGEVYVTGVTLKKAPTKLTYEVGEELDISGFELLVKYSDGSTKTVTEITEGYYLSCDMNTAGNRRATISCPGGYEVYFTYTVECSHNHTWEVDPVPSTCLTHGRNGYSCCALCGIVVKGSSEPLPLDDNNHPNFKYVGKVEPTCQKAGYSGDKTCADCGKVLEKGKDLEKIGHNVIWDTIVEATTTTNGSKKGKCAHCGVEFIVETAKLIETFDNSKVEGLDNVTVTLENNTAVPAEAVFVVENVTNTLDYLQAHDMENALGNTSLVMPQLSVVLDMGFVTRETAKDGSQIADQKVDFQGEVTITMPAPKEILEAENPVYLFHVLDNGQVEQVEYTLKNGVVTFTATGFSYYMFAEELSLVNMGGGPFGDLNLDEKIDAKDALMVLRLAVNKLEMTDELFVLGDVNFDEKVNAKDALEILKFAVGKPSVLDTIHNG